MKKPPFLLSIIAFSLVLSLVQCAKTPALSAPPPKGKPSLLNSYLPPAMQILAHLTNQMKYDSNATTAMKTTTTAPPTTAAPPSTVPTQAASPDSTFTTGSPATTTMAMPLTTTAPSTTTEPTSTPAASPSTPTASPSTPTTSPSTLTASPSTPTTSPSTTTILPSTTIITELADPQQSPPSSPLFPDLTTALHFPGVFAPVTQLRPVITEDRLDPEVLVVPPIGLDQKINAFPDPLLLPGIHSTQGIPVISSPYPQSNPYFVRNPYPIQDPNFPVLLLNQNAYFGTKSPLQALAENPLLLPAHFSSSDSQPWPYSEWLLKARSGEDDSSDIVDAEIPDLSQLPVQNENNFKLNVLELESGELSDENLQYLAPNVKEILQGVHGTRKMDDKGNPAAEFSTLNELYDFSGDRRDPVEFLKAKKSGMSQSMIQMLLLYDLLSRDAKKQKLNNYHGFTEDMVKDLSDVSESAVDQLRVVLERMVARGDCTHDFANNRAKEMAKELEKPDSRMSMEVRQLKPLYYSE